jgi:hypothetical protein
MIGLNQDDEAVRTHVDRVNKNKNEHSGRHSVPRYVELKWTAISLKRILNWCLVCITKRMGEEVDQGDEDETKIKMSGVCLI